MKRLKYWFLVVCGVLQMLSLVESATTSASQRSLSFVALQRPQQKLFGGQSCAHPCQHHRKEPTSRLFLRPPVTLSPFGSPLRPRQLLLSLRGGTSVLLASSSSWPWLPPALLCALSYAFYNLCIKRASDSIEPVLGGVVLQVVAAMMGACLWLVQQRTTSGSLTLISKSSVVWSVAAGVAVGVSELLSFWISSHGVPASQSIPVIVGGSVLIGTLLGRVWFQEALSPKGWAGMLLIAAGIALIGVDGGGGH